MNTQLRKELGALQGELMQREDQLGRFLKDIKRLEAINKELLDACKAALRLENDRRAGCNLRASDYADLYQQLTDAITKATKGVS